MCVCGRKSKYLKIVADSRACSSAALSTLSILKGHARVLKTSTPEEPSTPIPQLPEQQILSPQALGNKSDERATQIKRCLYRA
jgi:hypothetical protein